MKRFLAVISVLMLAALSCINVFAADVTNDTHKDSLVNYAGKGGLKYTTEDVLSFDSIDQVYALDGLVLDKNNKKEGTASLSKTYTKSTGGIQQVFETTRKALDFGISDRMKQTVKMWVYINDIDLLVCDHDGVYDDPQKGSGTLYISFAKDGGTSKKYSLQHTIEGSGWHLIEISFNTNNNHYADWIKTDLTKLKWMSVRVEAKAGLEIKFDGLTKYSYTNEGYAEPECPNGGRWLSTCDYNSLDGSLLTEWYASSFDLKDKTQGVSSLSITGRQEHVDYRCVWGGLDVPIDKNKDILHFDIYISDMDLVGKDFQARIAQSESGPGQACYSWGFNETNQYANDGDGLSDGWNSVDLPLRYTGSSIDNKYYADKGGLDFRADKMTFFWTGTSKEEWYTVKYDNIYVYTSQTTSNGIQGNTGITGSLGYSDEKIAELAKGIADGSITKIAAGTPIEDKQRILDKLAADYPDINVEFDEEGNVVPVETNFLLITLIIAGAAVLLAVIVAVVIIVVLPRIVKKNKPDEKEKKDEDAPKDEQQSAEE